MPAFARLRWFLLMFGSGVFLSIVWHQFKAFLDLRGMIPAGWLDVVIVELCVALIIGAFVGGIFEWWFQREAINDIVRAALGYMLPEPIKGEMAWMYGLSVIRTNYHLKLTIEPVSGQAVRLKQSLRQDRINRSGSSRTNPFFFAIDEWFNPEGSSAINGAGYIRGATRRTFSSAELAARTKSTGWGIFFSDEPVELQPGESITVWSETVQYRHESDREVVVVGGPVENPEIEIVVPDHLAFMIEVQHRERLINTAPNVYRLQGTLLPYQSISLRWWPKDRGAANPKFASGSWPPTEAVK